MKRKNPWVKKSLGGSVGDFSRERKKVKWDQQQLISTVENLDMTKYYESCKIDYALDGSGKKIL